MSSFANSFWGGSDYAGGLGVLFGKLQQGVQENQQVLTIARMRAEAEDIYGQKLGDIEVATNKIEGGFQKDDGASVKKAYDGLSGEMFEASRNHRKIASNIRELVVSPFGRWCDAHAARVQNSQDDLQARIKAHDKQADSVRTYRSQYYNKCRRVEDLDEEEKLAFQGPKTETTPTGSTPQSMLPTIKLPTIKNAETDDEIEDEPIEIGDSNFTPDQVKKILTHMLQNIKLGDTRVPILGTYQNVSTGADITEYIQKHLGGTSVSYAERIGQDLIGHGFLRLVGNVGNTFANSSRMQYQWRPKVFQLTGLADKKKPLGRTSTVSSQDSLIADAPAIAAVSEYLANWNPLNNQHPNETPAEKLRREGRESDERYKTAVRKLDALRCSLEEAMVDQFKFMERCELDRLKAIKSVILDFSGAISNVIPSLQSTVDNMMLFQETVQPLGDLRYFLENYRTGAFVPRVQIYENYYNNIDDQIFGVDIEARARFDRKRVPLVVTTLLTYLDNHYPDLEGDEARRGIWLADVPLAATHHLRAKLNTNNPITHEVLDKYNIPIVASVLKLYLLELPDSLVSSHVYEIIKTIYTTTAPNATETARVSVIQNTLGQLRLANIATLDALTTHFSRLIELTSADEAYTAALAANLAPCILRPKQENSLSMTEKFNVRLIRDLFAHKDAIFGELKRASSLSHTTSGASNRARAISTDESRRREHMEERQRAIAAAGAQRTGGRASSPFRQNFALGHASTLHRRDRSTSAETRFPIATASNTSSSPVVERKHRGSLEVPSSPPRLHATSAVQLPSTTVRTVSPPTTNGAATATSPPAAKAEMSFTGRNRSDTENTSNTAPISTSSFLTNPPDFTSVTQSHLNNSYANIGNAITSDYDTVTVEPITAAAVPATIYAPDVEKRNSLTRSAGAGRSSHAQYQRRTTGGGGLQRQSLIGKRDSTGSTGASAGNYGSGAAGTSGSESRSAVAGASAGTTAGGIGAGEMMQSPVDLRGVELVDRPMDD